MRRIIGRMPLRDEESPDAPDLRAVGDIAPPTPILERLFRMDALVGPVMDLGVTRVGHRRIVDILGGRVTGALEGQVLPGGADWQIVQPDGTVEIDTRYTVATAGGGLVHVRTRGLRSGPPDILQALLSGADVPPTAYSFRLVVDLETSVPDLVHLQRCVIVASALRTQDRVVYDAYRLA